MAIDTSGQLQTAIDIPENLAAKVQVLEQEVDELRARVATLETHIQGLQTAGPKKRVPPKTDETAPEGFTYLSDFCTQHFIPYQAAADLFPHMIRGQKIKVGRHLYPMIGPRGRHDFYVQLHTRPDFCPCDDCPHEVIESP